MIRAVEDYFAAMDAFDDRAMLELMTPDCRLEIPTSHESYRVRDTGITRFLQWRSTHIAASWHGDFRHAANADGAWVCSRFRARRTMKDGRVMEMDNVNFTEFRGARICAITIWMAERPGASEGTTVGESTS